MFFFIASSLTMGYRWEIYDQNMLQHFPPQLLYCSTAYTKKYEKNKKCYNHDCLAAPPSATSTEVWHDENSGCALWFRRRRRKRKFEKAHKSFYEIMIRKFFPLSQLEAKNRLNAFSLPPRLLLYKWALLSVRSDLRGGRTRRRRAVKSFYHLSDCNRTKKEGEVKQLAVQH